MSFFDGANFSFPVDTNDINSWADHCEFFCIISENKSQSIDELKDRLLDQHQRDFQKALSSMALTNSKSGKFIISSMEIQEVDFEFSQDQEEPEIADYEDVNENQQNNESEIDDQINNEFLFLFRFLEYRQNLFGDTYPFEIEIRENKLSLRPEISDAQNIYIALLLSSILRIFSASTRNALGHFFEELSLHPFKKIISPLSKIEFFGAGKKGIENPFFSGSFKERVIKLAAALKCDTTTLFKENQHDFEHSGDGGLDWVAWFPFSDDKSKMPIFFGQCACGNDWIDKEWDAHENKWSNLIQLNDSYLLVHFIAKSFRKQDGNWYKPGKIYKVILLDRLRIINSLSAEQYEETLNLYSDLINEALSMQYSGID